MLNRSEVVLTGKAEDFANQTKEQKEAGEPRKIECTISLDYGDSHDWQLSYIRISKEAYHKLNIGDVLIVTIDKKEDD